LIVQTKQLLIFNSILKEFLSRLLFYCKKAFNVLIVNFIKLTPAECITEDIREIIIELHHQLLLACKRPVDSHMSYSNQPFERVWIIVCEIRKLHATLFVSCNATGRIKVR